MAGTNGETGIDTLRDEDSIPSTEAGEIFRAMREIADKERPVSSETETSKDLVESNDEGDDDHFPPTETGDVLRAMKRIADAERETIALIDAKKAAAIEVQARVNEALLRIEMEQRQALERLDEELAEVFGVPSAILTPGKEHPYRGVVTNTIYNLGTHIARGLPGFRYDGLLNDWLKKL